MQFTDSDYTRVDRDTQRRDKGKVMPVESVGFAAIGKWLVGLVLAPWLWHERKRLDKLTEKLSESHYTKDEMKEKIEDKLAPIKTDVRWIRETMEKEYGKK